MGYGSDLLMGSTAQSGIVAAESRLNNKTHAASILKEIEKALDNKPDQPANLFMIGNAREKVELGIGSKQFFSSQLFNIKEGPNKTVYSGIKVFAGKSSKGKPLKTVVALGQLEGISVTGSPSGWSPNSAVMAGGNVSDGNAGMNVTGKSTFCGDLKLQNKAYVFSEDIWVNGNLNALSAASTSEFQHKVYINGDLTVQNNNGSSLFKDFVGIEGNLIYESAYTFNMPKNLWINGGSGGGKGIVGQHGSLVFSDEAEIHYNSGEGGLADSLFLNTTIDPNTGKPYIRGFSSATQYPNKIPNIPAAMGLETNLAARKDQPLPASFVKEMENEKYVVDLFDVFPWGAFSASALNTYYEQVKNGQVPGIELYNEHLVIRYSSGQYLNPASDPIGEFTKKVMFILEDGVTNFGSSGFYESGPESSTLIYAKKGAQLNIKSDYDFRGLIYVAPDNTTNHTLQFAQGKTITGAMHLHGTGTLTWNTGTGGNEPVNIVFDPDVLSGIVGTIGNAVSFDKTNESKTIKFRALGYYYNLK